MYDRILVPLDGSPFAEEVIPYALGLVRATGAKLVLLQVIEDESDAAPASGYLKPLAGRLQAEETVLVSQGGVAETILEVMHRHDHALAAMTTHGRTGLLEAILGSVAHSVVHDAGRAVLLYRPLGAHAAGEMVRPRMTTAIVAPLDGSDLSAKIIPHAVAVAKSLDAGLTLVQVVPAGSSLPPVVPRGDVLESSYINMKAQETSRLFGMQVDWEVLHGEPADSICEYMRERDDGILAMASHTRPGLRRTFLGSVTAECVRRAGTPILVYRPKRPG